MKNTLLLILFITLFHTAVAQLSTVVDTLLKVSSNQEQTFFDVQNNFNDYWGSKNVEDGYYIENGIRKKAYGWKQFKRWEYYWSNRVNPTNGKFPNQRASDFFIEQKKSSGDRNASGNWTNMGPTFADGGYSGIGRLNCVAFRTGDNNTLYTGSPSGGLWKTTDGGSNWTVLTDQNAVLGVSDAIVIAGASTSSDIVYIATGDRDGGSMWSLEGGQSNDNNSIGVLKSVDGGSSWATTGLSFTVNQKETVNRMLVNPNNNDVLYAATSDGLYQSTDAAATWSSIYSTEFVDIKFKPGDAQTIYASTRYGKIYLSTNGGSSWSNVSDNYSAGARRVDLAVSADEPTWVYAVEVNTSGGLFGVYKSTNSGVSFSLVYNSKNILEGNCVPSGTSGQGSYDLAIAADPNNANVIFIGGVNTWRSTDGGTNWAINNHWWGDCSVPAVHADHHFFAYQNGTSTLFACNDGGLYKTTDAGSTWSNIDDGLIISQLYRLGVSQTNSAEVIIGLQDNGTKALISGTWEDVNGGDGMECLIDYTDENIQYGESQYGSVKRTTNHWSTTTRITKDAYGNPINGLNETGYWVTPFVLDPDDNETIYLGLNNVWKSTNQGDSWSKISAMNSGSKIRSVVVAPSNNQIIYASDPNDLWLTSNGGTSWTNITSGLPVSYSYITYVSVKDDDPLTTWVSFGQYNSHGVYQTTDGGANWSSISTGLPSIPVMCVIQNTQNSSEDELYAATDVGVYVKLGGGPWALYSDGLPNVVVNELEIYYNSTSPNLSRIRAATSGRGLWESELYSPDNQPPIADFTADITDPGVSQTVVFADLSTNIPTSWLWNITPSTVTYVGGTSSTSQNPQVQFDATGDYTIQLTSTNAYGSDSESKTDYISVSSLMTYCSASGGGAIYMSGVQIGTINNTGTGAGSYSDYTLMSTDLTVNTSNDIIISYQVITDDNTSDLGIWIDWNHDGDFEDTGEDVTCVIGISDFHETYSISVPANALVGATIMRIRMKWSGVNCGDPCGITTYGEVEDYKINVLPGSDSWLGNNSNWNDESNWSDGNVPNLSYEVIIPTGVTSPIIQTGINAKCYSITLQNGATITINGNLEVEK